jgi:hypothetical protein
VYQTSEIFPGVSQRNICLEKRLSPDVCSRLACGLTWQVAADAVERLLGFLPSKLAAV